MRALLVVAVVAAIELKLVLILHNHGNLAPYRAVGAVATSTPRPLALARFSLIYPRFTTNLPLIFSAFASDHASRATALKEELMEDSDKTLEKLYGGSYPDSRAAMEIRIWRIDKLVFYARNPRKNDAVVDRMCGSIREFGFKIPCLVRSDGEVIDGHLRLKAARKLGLTEISCNPMRRMDTDASQSFPTPGEPVGYLGQLGRGTAGARITGFENGGLRPQPHRL